MISMIWAPVLHLYQPPTQFPKVLRQIAEESYVPLVSFLARNPGAKITLNINASLTEQLHRFGYDDLLRGIRKLVQAGQVELLGSAAYHPLLPRLPFSEMTRQIKLNEEINRRFLGEIYQPRGFFPPELAYSPRVGKVLFELGYEWVLVESCFGPREPVLFDRVYELSGQELLVFYRHKDVSLAIAFGRVKTADEVLTLSQKSLKEEDYLLTAMDGETFGHHWKDGFSLLSDLFSRFKTVLVSELPSRYPRREKTDPLESTWAATFEDCRKGNVYPRWDNPGGPLHPKQWELFNLAISVVGRAGDKGRGRKLLDKALHSDQFWWASHNPHWHLGMVARGLKLLVAAITATPGVQVDECKRARSLQKEILEEGIKLYGETPII